jgi:hypothetical protein
LGLPNNNDEEDDTSLRLDEASELLALLMDTVIKRGNDVRNGLMSPQRFASPRSLTKPNGLALGINGTSPSVNTSSPTAAGAGTTDDDMTLIDMVREVVPHVLDLIHHAKVSASTQLRAAHLQKSVSQTLANRKPKNQEEEDVLKWISQDFSSRRRGSSIDRFAARPLTGVSLSLNGITLTTNGSVSSSSSGSIVTASSSSASTSTSDSPRSPLKSPRSSAIGERALSFVNKVTIDHFGD